MSPNLKVKKIIMRREIGAKDNCYYFLYYYYYFLIKIWGNYILRPWGLGEWMTLHLKPKWKKKKSFTPLRFEEIETMVSWYSWDLEFKTSCQYFRAIHMRFLPVITWRMWNRMTAYSQGNNMILKRGLDIIVYQ